MKTEAESLRFLFVCDTDSQLYACRSLAEDLTDLGHACAFAILGEGKDLPPALRQRQLKEFPQTRETTWESLLADLSFLDADAVGVYLTGSRIHAFLQHARQSRPPEASPVYFCGFNGLVYEKFEEGMVWRLGYDVVCLNGPRDKAAFDLAFGHTKYAKQRTAIIGLNRGNSAAKRVPMIPFEQRPKLAVFAEQVKVPRTRGERVILFERLARLAAANPNWQIVVKPRVRPDERTFHSSVIHPETALAFVPDRPPNLVLSYEALSDLLPRTRILLTISSTAVFDAMAYGCKAVIIADYGLNNNLGTHVFLDSGLEISLSTINELDDIPVSLPKEVWARSIGWHVDHSVENLVQSILQVLRNRGERGSPPHQIPFTAQAARPSTTKEGDTAVDPVHLSYQLWKSGQTLRALQILETQRQSTTDNSRCRRLLAEIYIHAGKHSEAAVCLAEAFSIRPENRNLRRRLRAALSRPKLIRAIRLFLSRSYKPEGRPLTSAYPDVTTADPLHPTAQHSTLDTRN